jgi:hypothetical protein
VHLAKKSLDLKKVNFSLAFALVSRIFVFPTFLSKYLFSPYPLFFFSLVLGIKPRALSILGNHGTTEPHPQPHLNTLLKNVLNEPGLLVHVCNPSTPEAKAGGSRVQG